MSKKSRILIWILFVALFLSYFFSEKFTRKIVYQNIQIENLQILPSKKTAPILSMGFQNVMADLYLLQAQVHNHNTCKKGLYKDGKMLLKLMELIMELDPHYVDSFVFGSMALAEYWGDMGIADANKLLKKAWFNNQDEHRFPMYIGYNYYYTKNKQEAIKWFRLALDDPDAPKRLVWVIDALMSPDDLNSVIQRDAVCEVCNEAEEELQKEQYCLRCKFYIKLVELNNGAKLFRKREGRPMRHINEFIEYGYLDELPKEPLGGRWYVTDKGLIASTINNRVKLIAK